MHAKGARAATATRPLSRFLAIPKSRLAAALFLQSQLWQNGCACREAIVVRYKRKPAKINIRRLLFRITLRRIFTASNIVIIGGMLLVLSGGAAVWALHNNSVLKERQLKQVALRQDETAGAGTTVPGVSTPDAKKSEDVHSAQKSINSGSSPQQILHTASAVTTGAGGISAVGNTVAPANRRAMWVWDDSIALSVSNENQLFGFASAKGVQTLYFYSEGLIDSNPAALKAFISAAAAHSLDVEMLFGEPEWVFTSGHAAAVGYMKKAAALADALPAGSRPVGAHFDVEPKLGSDPQGIATQYLDLLDALRAAKGPLRFGADTSMAFDYQIVTRNGTSKELTKWVIDATDAVTLMSYRDHASAPDGIIDHGAMTVVYAASVGKRATLGVETTCGLDPEKITFCEEGNAFMEAELGKVKSYYGGSAGFNGVAIHDYDAYRILAP